MVLRNKPTKTALSSI